jgi:hypothetical protein
MAADSPATRLKQQKAQQKKLQAATKALDILAHNLDVEKLARNAHTESALMGSIQEIYRRDTSAYPLVCSNPAAQLSIDSRKKWFVSFDTN